MNIAVKFMWCSFFAIYAFIIGFIIVTINTYALFIFIKKTSFFTTLYAFW